MEQAQKGPALKTSAEQSGKGVMTSDILNIVMDMLNLFVCMVLSEFLLSNVAFGGALYLMGQVWIVYQRLFSRLSPGKLHAGYKVQGIALFVIAALFNVALIVVYPAVTSSHNFILLIIIVACFTAKHLISSWFALTSKLSDIKRIMALFGFNLLLSLAALPLIEKRLTQDELITSAALLVCHSLICALILTLAPFKPTHLPSKERNDSLMRVTSYRIYNKMTSNVFAAINVSLLSYVCYVRFQPQVTPMESFASICAWMMLISGIMLLCRIFLRREALTKYDKPSLFALGCVLWTAATIMAYNGMLPVGVISTLITNLLWGSGLGCMLSIVISMGSEVKQVLELTLNEEDAAAYQRNTRATIHLSTLITTMLMLMIFTISSFYMDGKIDVITAKLGVQDVIRTVMLLLPMGFVIAAFVYALMQPLDKEYAKKLKMYWEQAASGKQNVQLYDRLQFKLVRSTKRVEYRLLRILLRPFLPCRVVDADKVDTSEPAIFVCNHLEVYGPMITNLYIPYYVRPLIIASMLNKDLIATQLQPGIHKVFFFLPRKLRERLPAAVSGMMLKILDATEPIPVYREGRDVIKTIRMSVQALDDSDNLLIFPENTLAEGESGAYLTDGVSTFYTGFITIAEQYYKRTKRCAAFYPMYANKHKRTLTFGDKVTYDPSNGKAQEKQRVAGVLHDWMQKQGEIQ